MARKSPIRKRRRTASEFRRIYESEARVEWVKQLACCVPRCVKGPSENAHYMNGGTGRKADANAIVPLCPGHHRLLHSWGIKTFQRMTQTNLAEYAASVEKAWQLFAGKEA